LARGLRNHGVHLSMWIEPFSLPLHPIFVKVLYQNLDLLRLGKVILLRQNYASCITD
jgi:hypothetical protein